MGAETDKPLKRKLVYIHKKPILVETVPDLRVLANMVGADILDFGYKSDPTKDKGRTIFQITPPAPGRMLWLAAIFASASSAKMNGAFKANLIIDKAVVQAMDLELGIGSLQVIIVGSGSTGRVGFKDMVPLYQAGYQPIEFDEGMSLSITSNFPISVSFVAAMETYNYSEE